jgi:hypothetical protein
MICCPFARLQTQEKCATCLCRQSINSCWLFIGLMKLLAFHWFEYASVAFHWFDDVAGEFDLIGFNWDRLIGQLNINKLQQNNYMVR